MGFCLSLPFPSPSSTGIPIAMPNLTIRNLSSKPVTLKRVERFEGERVRTGNVLGNTVGTIGSFFNATNFITKETITKGESHTTEDVEVHVDPFTINATEIPAPEDGGKEVIRLMFEIEGHFYEIDAPSPSNRSSVMKKLDDAPLELTAVYVPSGAFLAIMSSANLHAWMAELQDHYPLPLLSIPGTHNSPTCHTALPSVRCQAVGVREQLDNGVRFLDIRVSTPQDSDDLALVHSAFPISLTGNKYFADMLSDIYAYLDANPTETVLMSLKREGTGKGTDEHLSRYMRDRYVSRDAHRWFVEPRIPTLGDCRGRIVLIRRYFLDESLHGEHDGRGWGIDAQHWPDNCEDGTVGGGLIRVQDFYEIDQSTNIERKIDYSRGQLERAAEQFFHLPGMPDFNADAPPLPFFVNFLSASNFFNATCWPERIAAKVNPAVVEYLCMNHGEQGKGPHQLNVGDAATGIIVTDWVGAHGDWDLIRCIVGMNSRLQLKQ
ncbi:phosphatidylinositol phospholipase c [Colletotrichum karsti]|uniref:Phosphatidylinositol phospholipase c n=1 Tax=Colletotrichum karsti TaxID=1095194 RepID=A0A9P6I9K7_9PEZI|nr:phosphatidylinositol phospholipase c [Colletotrichum karsti]KAF9876471.1 phosphatidylinositol phospholipase c [Colletotrichum karsti]